MRRRQSFSLICAAAASLFVFSEPNRAEADQILAFGQSSSSNTIFATNPTSSTTMITGTDVAIGITQIAGGSPTTAYLNITAMSVGAAQTLGSFATQSFSGSFTITSGTGGLGTNFLSGVFTDAVFGAGTGLTLTASNAAPGQSLTLSSSVIGGLQNPESINFAFSNVTPTVGVTNGTLNPFNASIAGNASASVVPEPGTIAMALTALPLLGVGALMRRRRLARA